MTTRTWDGSANSFSSSADWSPAGAPQPGDVALITAGTVGITATTLSSLTILLQGTAAVSPTLNFTDSTLAAGSVIAASASDGTIAIGATGTIENDGLITFTGPTAARFTTTLADSGTPALLRNIGVIAAIDASPNVVATAPGQALENDGAIAVWNPSHGIQFALFGPAITGTGTIQVAPFAQVELVQDVGAGQSVQFLGTGHSALQLDSPALFQGSIAGFAQTDTVTLRNVPFTAFTYVPTDATHGALDLTDAGTPVAALNFTGSYSTADFNLLFTDLGGGLSSTSITVSTPIGPGNFGVADTTLNMSTSDAGTPYSGPITYLQHQFVWGSPDAVAISAAVNNAFVHGGPADDALAVIGGQNVLDGGGASNFLVGASGSDGGTDTFFLDGRGGAVTWSTIVDFHHGDMATVFGFIAGTSTVAFTPTEGAAGFQGVTLHSELGGPNTGVNASLTFAGMTLADLQGKVVMQTGITGGTGYLAFTYTG